MSAEKILKPRNIRRGILALLLIAPLVYMFGSLFTALNGSHQSDFDGSTTSQWVDVNTRPSNDDELKITFFEVIDTGGGRNLSGNFNCNGITFSNMVVYQNNLQFYNATINLTVYRGDTDTWLLDSYRTIYASGTFYNSLTQSNILYLQQNSGIQVKDTYSESDYLFNQFFAKDNWVSSLGARTLAGENVYGFSAFSDLIRYADENGFHIGESDWGQFLYGYATYAVNTLIIYEMIAIGIAVLMIPLRVTDWLGNKGDIDL